MVKLKGNFESLFLPKKTALFEFFSLESFESKRFETNFWQLCLGVVTICNIVSLELKLCFRFMSK